MGEIRLLEPSVAERIAAGEVVERPASCVKELVENALDAGARRIAVRLWGGGLARLQVQDDGHGLRKEEMPLALMRHATSKITSLEDLLSLQTLGFRGEALSAIAAISRLRMVSRRRGKKTAWEVVARGGEILHQGEAPLGEGTLVEVEDLYFNTPARLESLASPRGEEAAILRQVAALAFAFPHVAFRMEADGKLLWYTGGEGDLLDGARPFLGPDVDREGLPFRTLSPAPDILLEVEGVLGKSTWHRAQRSHQLLVVNGHPIFHAGLRAAVEAAYRERLQTGRRPVFALHLKVPPATLDINIHPRKQEARFQRERALTGLLHRLLQEILGMEEPPRIAPSGEIPSFRLRESPLSLLTQVYREDPPEAGFPPASDGELEGRPFPSLEFLAVFRHRYLLAQSQDTLYVVDFHAAHERILFETYEKAQGSPPSQPLLEPWPWHITPEEVRLFEERYELFQRIGFAGEAVGPQTVALRAIPSALVGASRAAVEKAIADVLHLSSMDLQDLRRPIQILAACKAAVKSGDRLFPGEAQKLLEDLARCREPFHCPHGRPILWAIPEKELDRRFGR
ncbi:MAG: DNA mismatch repair endonuclease MutL [Bacillota bacterium]|nr:DNA mismatch repair endonuclease MutL [Bacillota bacterium]